MLSTPVIYLGICIYVCTDRENVYCVQGDAMCKSCFYSAFEEEIHKTIVDAKLFCPGDRVAVGASGGKGNWL